MSFYIDMKMILLWQCSGSHLMSVIIISASISNVVNPKKIFHSNSVDSTISLYGRDSINQLTFSFHALTGSWLMPPIHSTESEKTKVFAVANWTAPVSKEGCPLPHLLLPIDHWITCNFFLIRDQLPSYMKAAFTSRFSLLSSGLRPYLCLTFEKTFWRCGT